MYVCEYYILPYILSLPKPETEAEKKALKKASQPFIIGDDIADKIHMTCGGATLSRVFNVFIPGKDETYEIIFPHYRARDPLKACKASFRKRRLDEGKSKEYIEQIINTFFQKIESSDDVNPEIKLIEFAKAQDITRWYHGKCAAKPSKGYLLR